MSRSHRASAFLAGLGLVTIGVLGAAPAFAAPAAPGGASSTAAPRSTTGATIHSPGASAAATTGASTSTSTGASTSSTSSTAGSTTTSTGTSTGPTAPAAGPPCPGGVVVATPVICLPDGSGEDQPGELTVGGSVDFAAQIVDNGPAVGGSTVVFTLPPQLRPSTDQPVARLDDWYDDNADPVETDLTCTSSADGATYSCETGPLAQGANILVVIELDATSAATAGGSASFSATLQGDPAGSYPSTSVSATVDFLAPVLLDVAVDPTHASVTVGTKRTLTVSVRNAGTTPAPDTVAVTLVASRDGKQHFTIANAPALDSGAGGVFVGARRPAVLAGSIRALDAARRAAAHGDPAFAIWPLGTIAPGATATFGVQVQARSVGTALLFVAALTPDGLSGCADTIGTGESGTVSAGAAPGSDPNSADPNSADPGGADPGGAVAGSADPGCDGVVTANLTAIAAAAVPSPAGSGNPIAQTGAAHVPGTVALGLVAVLLGGLLTVAGSRRYRARHTG